MLIAERRRLLLQQVHDRGYVSFRELAEALDISESTVRRDLRSMVDEGLVEATRGGVGPIRRAPARRLANLGTDRPGTPTGTPTGTTDGDEAGATGWTALAPGVLGRGSDGPGVPGRDGGAPGVPGRDGGGPGVLGRDGGGPGVLGRDGGGPGVLGRDGGAPGVLGRDGGGPGVLGRDGGAPGVLGRDGGGPGDSVHGGGAPGSTRREQAGPGVTNRSHGETVGAGWTEVEPGVLSRDGEMVGAGWTEVEPGVLSRSSDPLSHNTDPLNRSSDPLSRRSDPLSRSSVPLSRSDEQVIRRGERSGGTSGHRGDPVPDEREAIAALAVTLIVPGTAILLGPGRTTTAMARRLAGIEQLTVVTNSVAVTQALVDLPQIDVVFVGGALRRSIGAVVGPITEQALQGLRGAQVFLSGEGVTAERGLTTPNVFAAATDQALMAAGRQVVVLADHTKTGHDTMCQTVPTDRIDILVTDSAADPDTVRRLRAEGVDVRIA